MSGVVLSGPVGVALRAPPSGPRPHLLLSLAHYTYFFHDPRVATAAVHLLGSGRAGPGAGPLGRRGQPAAAPGRGRGGAAEPGRELGG